MTIKFRGRLRDVHAKKNILCVLKKVPTKVVLRHVYGFMKIDLNS